MYVSKVWLTVGGNVRDDDDDGGNGNGGREQRRRYIVDGSWSSECDEIANGRIDGRTVWGWFKMNLEWGFRYFYHPTQCHRRRFRITEKFVAKPSTQKIILGLLSPSEWSRSFHSDSFQRNLWVNWAESSKENYVFWQIVHRTDNRMTFIWRK